MAIDLYAGIPVRDYPAALAWYEKLFGTPPTFIASDTEAVWERGPASYVDGPVRDGGWLDQSGAPPNEISFPSGSW